MMISAVIPTYKREHLLREAVMSVLSQDVPGVETEVIVVNDANEALQHADWQDIPGVMVVNTHQKERCVARNTGAALARGKYLHFLDDDDTMLPGAYAALLDAAERTGAAFTFGSFEALFDEGAITSIVRPDAVGHAYAVLVAGMGITLGAGLVRKDTFLAAGGFDLSFTVMEDMELLQRISVLGEFAGVQNVVARWRAGGHMLSTTALHTGSDACRRQREKAFNHPDCLTNLATSLREHCAPELRGFLVRFYFGSACRMAKRGMLLASVSRIGAGIALLGPGMAYSRFWKAVCGRETLTLPGLSSVD
ncbi:MAG: glycosyltransferase family 2 protein [Armatimonadota bacterium]